MSLDIIARNKCFGGWQQRCRHHSKVLDCTMTFSVYLPPQAMKGARLPVLYWLSGLTCTDENFTHKAGAQRVAAELGLVLVMPDTSPRGEGVPDDPDEAWDFGLGAGFYVNATQQPWAQHYRMHDYVVSELPALIEVNFPVSEARAISGHSMGGHGALVCALRNPGVYRSVSAFSPIGNPISCPWGEKAFTHLLGDDHAVWKDWDACALIAATRGKACERLPILVDQGEDDEFLSLQLKPDVLKASAEASEYPLTLRRQPGYDHSYYFVASFIEEHLRYHAERLA